MKHKLLSIFVLLALMLGSCKNEKSQLDSENATKAEIATTAAFISGWTVKDSSGVAVKDSLKAVQSFTYSESGRELSNIFYNPDGTEARKDVFQYNKEGQKTGSKYYENGRHTITYKYDLDAEGRRVGFTALEAQSGVEMYKGYSQFLEGGRLRRDGVPAPGGVISWNYEYTFDNDGEETGYVFIDANGRRYPSSYQITKRDEEGRWSQRSVVEDDKVIAIETREYRKL